MKESVTIAPPPAPVIQSFGNLAAAHPAFSALAANQGAMSGMHSRQIPQSGGNSMSNVMTSPRPIRTLREVPNRFNEYLILEFAEHELASIMDSKISFQERHIKCLMK